MRDFAWLRVAGCLGMLAVGIPARGQLDRSRGASATVSARAAHFAFPREDTVLTYAAHPNGLTVAAGAFLEWRVSWDPPDARLGLDPDGLWIVQSWKALPSLTMPLRAIVDVSPVQVTTFCVACGSPASLVRQDAAVAASVDGDRIVFTVTGRAAVRRLFRQRPDSVLFSRTTATGDEVRLMVPVQR
jgi:hypothetical protein